ncbi:MAG: GNAT family N-acetyltransferase [Chitinophagales bacterium]
MKLNADHLLASERLLIFPLSPAQLLKYVEADDSLEKELGLTPSGRTISPELKEALHESILPAVAANSTDLLFYTLWTMFTKHEHQMVGDLCFKGPPNEQHEIEIGYGTYTPFRGNGYMTEAINAMIRWASGIPNVAAIIAETDKNNVASIRALQKNHFVAFKTTESMIWWRIPVR